MRPAFRFQGTMLMTEYDWQTVFVRNKHNGRWHVAQRNMVTATLFTPEACNLDDAERLEVYPALPESVEGSEMCRRCYPTSAD